MRTLSRIIGVILLFAPAAARAEFQISGYGGFNTASNSDVTLHTPLFPDATYDVDWFGDSFHMPPYWGVRGTWWLNDFGHPHWGVAIDYTHAKVKAPLDDDALQGDFSTLEFTDGLNTAAVNAIYRTPLNNRFTVYAGAGAGVAFPHVEVETNPSSGKTFEYQVTGPTVQGMIGINMNIAYGFSAFAEYKANYSWNDADLVGGGSLETNVLTHQFAVGLSYSFGAPPQY